MAIMADANGANDFFVMAPMVNELDRGEQAVFALSDIR